RTVGDAGAHPRGGLPCLSLRHARCSLVSYRDRAPWLRSPSRSFSAAATAIDSPEASHKDSRPTTARRSVALRARPEAKAAGAQAAVTLVEPPARRTPAPRTWP